MPAFPAVCPNCRAIFPFHGIGVAEGTRANITFEGNTTNCPICGNREAKISDGIFSANTTAVEIISAPTSTHSALAALKAIAERAAKGTLSREEAIEQATALAPEYGSLLERYYTLGMPAIAVLVALLGIYISHEDSVSSPEEMKKILNLVTEQTFVINDLKHSIEHQPSTAAMQNANRVPSSAENPSGQRTKVNRERRRQLRLRRNQFGGTRRH